MEKFRNAFGKVVNGINYIGLALCFATVFIVSIDVILRKLSNASLSVKGSNEMAAYFLVVIVMLAIPVLQVKKGHIWVNMFVDKFPKGLRSKWLGVVQLIEVIVSFMFTYGAVLKLQNFLSTGTTTDVLNMPKWPFALIILIGFAELTVLIFIDMIQMFRGKDEENLQTAEN